MTLQYLILRQRWINWEERFYVRLARKMPKKLRMWVFTTVFADVMCNVFPDRTPDEPTAMDVYAHVANLNF